MRTEVRISEDMLADGISAWISRKGGGGMPRQILRVAQDGQRAEWDDLDPHGAGPVNPTIRLTDEQARALLDALLRHYQGASDMHTVRADLLHERKRADDLIAVLGQLAIIQAQR